MKQNGPGSRMARATSHGMASAPRTKRDERKRKEARILEVATEIAVELYGPALKELEKY